MVLSNCRRCVFPSDAEGMNQGTDARLPDWGRSQFQVNERGLDPSVFQPPAQVVQLNPVEQHMPRKAVPQRVCPKKHGPERYGQPQWPGRTACCTHLQTVTRETSISLPWLTVPKLVASGQGGLQLRMDRDHPGLSSLALPDNQCGSGGLNRGAGPGLPGPGHRTTGGLPATVPA